jgi:hypothetical protein
LTFSPPSATTHFSDQFLCILLRWSHHNLNGAFWLVKVRVFCTSM